MGGCWEGISLWRNGGLSMEQGLVTVIGMSIAYAASFLGMALAWYGWKKRHGEGEE